MGVGPSLPSPVRREVQKSGLRPSHPLRLLPAHTGTPAPAEIILQLNARQGRARSRIIRPKPASRRRPITINQ